MSRFAQTTGTIRQSYFQKASYPTFDFISTPMAAFPILLGLGSQHQPITYNQLYAAESAGKQNARHYYMTRRSVGAGGGTTVPPEALIGPIGLVATTRSSNNTSYGVPTSL